MRKLMNFVLLALLGLALLPGQTSAQQVSTDATVTPRIGPPGTRFLVVINGYQEGEDVVFWLNAPNGTTSSVNIYNPYEADRSGRVVFPWDAPENIASGQWQFVGRGLRTNQDRVASFEIGTPPAPESTTASGIQPQSGEPGDAFRFFLTGFAAGESVDVQVYDPNDQPLRRNYEASPFADENGRIDGNVTVPVDGVVGIWRIVGRGMTSETERTITFEIVSPITSTTNFIVSPGVGRAGTRFLFSGTGYGDEETLAVWLNAPNGRIVLPELETRLEEPQSGPDGRVSLSWVAPRDIQPGFWQIVVRGNETGVQQVASFEIQ